MATYTISSQVITNAKSGKSQTWHNVNRSEAVYDKASRKYTAVENRGYTVRSRKEVNGKRVVTLQTVSGIFVRVVESEKDTGLCHLEACGSLNADKLSQNDYNAKSTLNKSKFKVAKQYLLNEEGFKDLLFEDMWNYVSLGIPVPETVSALDMAAESEPEYMAQLTAWANAQ